jgi:hypothetical protein
VPTDDVFTILLLMVSQLVGYLSIGSWWVALLVFGNIYLALRVARITDSRGFPSRTQLNSLMLALIPTLMLLGILGRLSVYRGTFGAGLMALLVIAVYACAVVREINKGRKASSNQK